MWKRIKRLFGRASVEPVAMSDADEEYEMYRAMVAQAVFQTGKPYIGNVNDDGSFTMKPLRDK